LRAFVGLIAEVELFNRAFSQQEIQAIYNAGSAGKCKGTPTPTPRPTATATAHCYSDSNSKCDSDAQSNAKAFAYTKTSFYAGVAPVTRAIETVVENLVLTWVNSANSQDKKFP
jgi:hypothetical protein